jgi:DNA (cytosine-5)-methyltransferase 1
VTQLVLSLFPGIGLLDMAFEEEGFCVVRGPDLLWGGDIRRFHPPAGRFDGVIGGPPCQAFSPLANIVRAKGQTPKANLIPEFERVVYECDPRWYVMENVTQAPEPKVAVKYGARSVVIEDAAVGGSTSRTRRFSIGFDHRFQPSAFYVDQLPLYECEPLPAVLASASKMGGRPRNGRARLPGQLPRPTLTEALERQGLPADFFDGSPLTSAGKYLVVGNGVPLPMGRAVAKAVKRALGIGGAV